MADVVYMKITKDEFELPVAVADSPKELAKIVGTKPNYILSSISHAKKDGYRSAYVKVILEDD